MMEEIRSGYSESRRELEPRAFNDAQEFYTAALVLSAREESYQAMIDSLKLDAYEDIFEES